MLKYNRLDLRQWKVACSLLAAIGSVLLVSATATSATTRHVSLTGTDWIGPKAWNFNLSCSDIKPCRSIGWAATWAQPGDLIFVHEGHYVEQPITVSKNLTIQGVGAYPFCSNCPITSVDGNQQGSVFTIEPSVNNAILLSMIISNGKYGITNQGKLAVVGCLVGGSEKSETDAWAGSGIKNQAGATLALGNSWLLGNKDYGLLNFGTASLDGVWIFNNNDGIRNLKELALANSVIWNNYQSGVSNQGKLVMVNATISGNRSLGGDIVAESLAHRVRSATVLARTKRGRISALVVVPWRVGVQID